ncbi:MAG: hypothetical protein AB7Q81_18865 [Gammaproteobacteria bacterium]
MKSRILALLAVIGALVLPMSAGAVPINLSFTGQVDSSGATVGGVGAPIGSLFSLDLVIDDANAALGSYAITSVSYTTVVGTYATTTAWNPLTVTGSGAAMNLTRSFQSPDEHLLIDLTNFAAGSVFDDPLSWNGAAITGDIIVRGVGGFGSPDQLSGISPFSGTLAVTVGSTAVAEPVSMALYGLGIVGFAAARRFRHDRA